MTVIRQDRQKLGNVVVTEAAITQVSGVDYNYDALPVGASTNTVIDDIMGLACVWDNANTRFVPFNTASAALLGGGDDSVAPNGNVAIIVVSDDNVDRGNNSDSVTLTTTAQSLVSMYRGDAVVKSQGILYQGTTSDANKDAFMKQLEKQGIAITNGTIALDPKFTD